MRARQNNVIYHCHVTESTRDLQTDSKFLGIPTGIPHSIRPLQQALGSELQQVTGNST